jgi:hypothetical protein
MGAPQHRSPSLVPSPRRAPAGGVGVLAGNQAAQGNSRRGCYRSPTPRARRLARVRSTRNWQQSDICVPVRSCVAKATEVVRRGEGGVPRWCGACRLPRADAALPVPFWAITAIRTPPQKKKAVGFP